MEKPRVTVLVNDFPAAAILNCELNGSKLVNEKLITKILKETGCFILPASSASAKIVRLNPPTKLVKPEDKHVTSVNIFLVTGYKLKPQQELPDNKPSVSLFWYNLFKDNRGVSVDLVSFGNEKIEFKGIVAGTNESEWFLFQLWIEYCRHILCNRRGQDPITAIS